MKLVWLLVALAPGSAFAQPRLADHRERDAPPSISQSAPARPTSTQAHSAAHHRLITLGAPVNVIQRPRIAPAKARVRAPSGAKPEPGDVYPEEVVVAGPASAPKPHSFSYHGHLLPARPGGLYAYPVGFLDQKWRAGQSLPAEFATPANYYGDWETLGLAPPPPDGRWIRYGHDVVLVRVATGEIQDAAYDAIL